MTSLSNLNRLGVPHGEGIERSIQDGRFKVVVFDTVKMGNFFWVHFANQNISPAPAFSGAKEIIKVFEIIPTNFEVPARFQHILKEHIGTSKASDPPQNWYFQAVGTSRV